MPTWRRLWAEQIRQLLLARAKAKALPRKTEEPKGGKVATTAELKERPQKPRQRAPKQRG